MHRKQITRELAWKFKSIRHPACPLWNVRSQVYTIAAMLHALILVGHGSASQWGRITQRAFEILRQREAAEKGNR